MSETKLDKLQAAMAELQDLGARYGAAVKEAAAARREETHLLNRLNKAQAAVDAIVQDIKDAAPNGTDWKRPPSYPDREKRRDPGYPV